MTDQTEEIKLLMEEVNAINVKVSNLNARLQIVFKNINLPMILEKNKEIKYLKDRLAEYEGKI